jgi:hypothetical protein
LPSADATLTTPHAARYVAQLARHAAAMADGRGHRMHTHGTGDNPLATGEVTLAVQQDADQATLTFSPWGSCTAAAAHDRLSLRIDAADAASLQRIQQIITRISNGSGDGTN